MKLTRFKVKTYGWFDQTILKVNQIHYKIIEIFTKDLTQARASFESTDFFSSWIYSNTSTPLKCDFETPLKVSNHLFLLIL